MAITPSPAMIARDQLYAIHKQLTESTAEPAPQTRLQLAQLAALVEIADRLEGIEKSFDLGITVRTTDG